MRGERVMFPQNFHTFYHTEYLISSHIFSCPPVLTQEPNFKIFYLPKLLHVLALQKYLDLNF